MLNIFYCEDIIFDLPPPTLFYKGDNNSLLQLIKAIEQMISSKTDMCLNDYDFVNIEGTDRKIVFKPFSNNCLFKITDNEIVTDISENDWRIIMDKFNILISSNNSLTYFIEFENYLEKGNIVLES